MGDPIVTENRRDSTQDTSIVYKNMDCDSRGPKLSPAAVKTFLVMCSGVTVSNFLLSELWSYSQSIFKQIHSNSVIIKVRHFDVFPVTGGRMSFQFDDIVGTPAEKGLIVSRSYSTVKGLSDYVHKIKGLTLAWREVMYASDCWRNLRLTAGKETTKLGSLDYQATSVVQ